MNLTKKEYVLWIASLLAVVLSNLVYFDPLQLIAAVIGVTSLILAAKGNPISQILIVIFSIIYGIISYRFRYYGEMITYMGMTMPMAIWATVTWFKNPSEDKNVVKIRTMTNKLWFIVISATVLVTGIFFFILKFFDTPNLLFSTLSVTTTFLAVSLTMLRSSYYAVFYAMNDVVLIILWTLATMSESRYFAVIVIFVIFLINDVYGFLSWKRREKKNEN